VPLAWIPVDVVAGSTFAPAFVTLSVVEIVLAVRDARALRRELVFVSWAWVLLAAPIYLWVRSRHVENGRRIFVASLVMLATVIGLSGVSLAPADDAVATMDRLYRPVDSALSNYRDAVQTWAQAPPGSSTTELVEAASTMVRVVNDYRTELLSRSWPPELQDDVQRLARSTQAFEAAFGAVAGGGPDVKLQAGNCRVGISMLTVEKGLFAFEEAATGAAPLGPQVDALPADELMAGFCAAYLPFLSAVDDAQQTARHVSTPSEAVAMFDSMADAEQRFRDRIGSMSWPPTTLSAVGALSSSMDRDILLLRAIAGDVRQAASVDLREDARQFRQASNATTRAINALGQAMAAYQDSLTG
jgi:hypothetical protein